MFSTTGTISLDSIATLAQVLPALLAIGLLVPLLARMPLQSPERWQFGFQTVYVLAVEGLLLWFLIQGEPAPAGFRWIFGTATLWSLLGIAIVVLAWARSTRAERDAEKQQWRDARAAVEPKPRRSPRTSKPKRGPRP